MAETFSVQNFMDKILWNLTNFMYKILWPRFLWTKFVDKSYKVQRTSP